MRVSFAKLSGAGNDFVLVDERERRNPVEWARQAPVLCDRRNGVGADGIVLLRPSASSDFEVVYYNADGSPGSMCGNGARCAVKFVAGEGPLAGRSSFKFELGGRGYSATVHARGAQGKQRPGEEARSQTSGIEQITLEMTDPTSIRPGMTVQLAGRTVTGHAIDTGTPHFVVFASEAGMDPDPSKNGSTVLELGRAIRSHETFKPRGTNVNFLWPGPGPESIRVRTFEKGVEDETLSCGTGAVASAVIHSLEGERRETPGKMAGMTGGKQSYRIEVIPRSGETGIVEFTRSGDRVTDVRLTGPARETFRGTVEIHD